MTIKFRDKLIGLVLIILIIVGAASFWGFARIADSIEKDTIDRLTNSKTTYEEFNNSYFNQLQLQAVALTDNPRFVANLGTNDRPTIEHDLREFNLGEGKLNAEIFIALNNGGEVLGNAGLDRLGKQENINLRQRPEVAAALEGNDVGGVWLENGQLYSVAAASAIIADQVLGVIVLGRRVSDEACDVIQKVTTSNIAYLANGKIAATNLKDKRDNLLSEINQHKDMIDGVMIKKETSPAFRITIDGERYLAVASPILANPGTEGQDKKVIAAYIFFSSLDKALAPLTSTTRTVGFVGIGVVLLVLVVGYTITGGLNKPVKQLVEATKEIASGNLNFEVKVKTKDELGQLGIAFNDMTHGLRDKRRVEGLFGKYLSPDVAKKVLSEQSLDGILKGEKAKLSVMFTDIRGFTPMSRGMDPQELINLLNSHFDESIDIIDKYGGTLDKFIGDAIMAFFGAPVHYDDFFMRAINAAVQMQRASEKFNFQRKLEGKEPVSIGIGINTGDVVVGNIGSNKRLEYTVIGETVNIANRLCSVAKKGQIIISQSTYELLPNKDIAAPVENLMLKGVSETVTAYEIIWKS